MYKDKETGKWIERYPWVEADSNTWIGYMLMRSLEFHNNNNCSCEKDYGYLLKQVPQKPPSEQAKEAAKRHNIKSAYRVQRASDVYKEEQRFKKELKEKRKIENPERFVFVSVHCNSLGRPDDPKHPVPNPTRASNYVIYRFPEDYTLAEKIASALKSYLPLKEIDLPPDPRIGRTTSIKYAPPHEKDSPRYMKLLVLSRSSLKPIGEIGCRCPGCLIENVTLTNYEDEDYVSSSWEGPSWLGWVIHLGIDKYVESQP